MIAHAACATVRRGVALRVGVEPAAVEVRARRCAARAVAEARSHFVEHVRDSAGRSGSPAAGSAARAAARGSAPAVRSAAGRAAPASRAVPTCRGAGGRRRFRRASRPRRSGPRTSPATRSAISATTPRSWVIRMTARSRSRLSSSISRRICAWTVTSSAVVGSSAISTSGSSASAIAIITRWRIPPENSCG